MELFKRIHTGDDELNAVQDELERILNPVLNNEILSNNKVTEITLVSGKARNILHKLNRVPEGWIIIQKDSNADIWANGSSNPDKFLNLESDANVTISILVF